jgi:hypothetical protein
LATYIHFNNAEEFVFRKEDLEQYKMIVLRDFVPAAETDALRELKRIQHMDWAPVKTIWPPLDFAGVSRTISMDLSDYYDMSMPGQYQVTVTRGTVPFDESSSIVVRSNTITLTVQSKPAGRVPQTREKPRPQSELSILQTNAESNAPPMSIRGEMKNISPDTIRECKCWSMGGMYSITAFRNG